MCCWALGTRIHLQRRREQWPARFCRGISATPSLCWRSCSTRGEDIDAEILGLAGWHVRAQVAIASHCRFFMSASLARSPLCRFARSGGRVCNTSRFGQTQWSPTSRRLTVRPRLSWRWPWLLALAPNVLLIPGTSKRSHLAENLQAGTIALHPDQVTALTERFA
jgi:hypothetical protein